MEGSTTPTDPVEAALLTAAIGHQPSSRHREPALSGHPPDEVLLAIAALVLRTVRRLVDHGWRPGDLAQIRSRRLTTTAGLCLFDVLHQLTSDDGRLRSDPVWTGELREVTAGTAALDPRPTLVPAMRDPGWPFHATLAVALDLLSGLIWLPKLPTTTPLRTSGGDSDTAMLVKVRALLAKAERTEFEHEADAFTAKAQQLMARHSIDAAMIAETDPSAGPPGTAVHRIWLDSPYVRAKFALVTAVAEANGCQALFNTGLEVATVVGLTHDVRATVLLTTSLQLQAARAVTHARPDPEEDGWTTSVRAYRRGFLFAFAARIGERLRDATTVATADLDPGALLPVLADRTALVQRAVAEAFPRTKTLRRTSVDASGWAAGRAAADLARLGTGRALRGAP